MTDVEHGYTTNAAALVQDLMKILIGFVMHAFNIATVVCNLRITGFEYYMIQDDIAP